MKDKIQRAFDDIRADDALLANTAAHLQKARAKHPEKRRRIKGLRLVGAMAAMLALAIGLWGYRAFYANAAAYVSIDVNPSVELTLNRLDKVIASAAYNAEGKAILQQVDVTGRPYDSAITMLLAEMELQGYISNDAFVTMTVQTADSAKEQDLCNALQQSAGRQVRAGDSPAKVEVFPVTQEVRETANGCHMSAAKYLAIQELLEVDDTATLETYSGSTLHQIRQRTRECRREHSSTSDTENRGGGQAEGSGQNPNDGHGQGNGPGQSNGQNHGSSQSQGDGQGQGNGQGHGQTQGGGHGHGGRRNGN